MGGAVGAGPRCPPVLRWAIMDYNQPLPKRRSIRLFQYDYSRSGYYFVTICTQERRCLFGAIQDGQMKLNGAGRAIGEKIREMPAIYRGVWVDCAIVMPNHVHILIGLSEGYLGLGVTPDRTQSLRPELHPDLAIALAEVVKRYKTISAATYRNGVRNLGWQPYPGRLWQRNYYEHIIRDSEGLSRVREYITSNPQRWSLDRENFRRQGVDPFDAWIESSRGDEQVDGHNAQG